MNYGDRIKETNPIAYRVIKNAITNDKVSHAYLFSATKNVVIGNEPLFLIQSLINENPFENTKLRSVFAYPDFTVIDGSEEMIKKEQVISAVNKLHQTSLDEIGVKVLFIKNVENANKQSLNSLLKFIEEPTKKTFIIMTTNNVSQVISTIRSRAQIVNLRSQPFEKFVIALNQDGINEKIVRLVASMTSSRTEAAKLADSIKFDKYLDMVTDMLTKAIHEPSIITTSLQKSITKASYKEIFLMLRTFFNDIWKVTEGVNTNFPNKELIQKYSDIDFNFSMALEAINDFIISQSNHVNFELYKTMTLTKIAGAYE